jgi:hypothetical protein
MGEAPARPLGIEGGALPDSEAMLLVDDRHRQRVELDGLLDQCMGPDHELGLAGRERVEQCSSARRRCG